MGTNQFGGRKGYNSLQAAIMNELIIDYHRITYMHLGIMQHDVKACFDRTIPSITTLCNRKFQIPIQICKFVNHTKANMKYHPVTHYGVSKKYYKHTPQHPIYGSGQGSGNAGQEWNFISVILMKLMEKNSDGCEITHPNKKNGQKQ